MELHHSSVDTECFHYPDLSMCLNNQKSSGLELFIFRSKESAFPKSLGDILICFTLQENSGSSYCGGPKHPKWITPQSTQWFNLKRCGYTFLAAGRNYQVYYAERSMQAFIVEVWEVLTTKVSIPHELFILLQDEKKFSRKTVFFISCRLVVPSPPWV